MQCVVHGAAGDEEIVAAVVAHDESEAAFVSRKRTGNGAELLRRAVSERSVAQDILFGAERIEHLIECACLFSVQVQFVGNGAARHKGKGAVFDFFVKL